MTSKKAKITVKEDDCSELLSASAETVFSNIDLVTEILLRVPAKPLVKFKCVCKDWNKLISSLRFIYNQFAQNKKLVSNIYFPYYGWQANALACLSLQSPLSVTNLSFLHEFHNGLPIYLEHSCNGLMLFKDMFGNYCVCNLTTRQYVTLPQSPHNKRYASRACLAFDPMLSPYYKVVLISDPICIYFSGNKSWKIVQFDAPVHTCTLALWDGAIHWMDESNNYFRFMVDEETLITTQMPPKPEILKAQNIHFFGECDGRLLLIQSRMHLVMGLTILEMKRGTFCWNVKYRVNLRHALHIKPTKGRNFHVLSVVKESSESDMKLVLATPTNLFSYNLKRRTMVSLREISLKEFKDITDFPYYDNPVGRCFPYIENLFAVSFGTRI